jgi:hypothetical protein
MVTTEVHLLQSFHFVRKLSPLKPHWNQNDENRRNNRNDTKLKKYEYFDNEKTKSAQ